LTVRARRRGARCAQGWRDGSWRERISRESASRSKGSPPRSRRCGGFFDVEGKRRALADVERRLTDPAVWGDGEASRSLQQQRARLVGEIGAATELETLLADSQTLLELSREGEDVGSDLDESVGRLARRAETIELETLLSGEHDAADALLEIHPGAGGTESQDWAAMLLRMYGRWAERRGFKVETLDYQAGDEAGIKSATLRIQGTNAYGYLQVERGVHRLVRISPFDAQGRRHTSFASVDVLPDVDEDFEVAVEDKELRVDTFRASGAGGQHVNKTDSAVRITHLPTGIVITCQNERSQHRNREVAMKILRAKLHDRARREAEEKMAKEVGEKKKIEWGSQIRSYVLAPYRLVKDHRTGFEQGDADRVLDGDLDGFMRRALGSRRETGASAAGAER
jgi:peptide chain release factor 2